MTKIRLLGVALAVLGMAATARTQSATGQITGTVKDTSGAVVPGVTVTVTSELTGSKRETTTGQTGNYVVPLLPVLFGAQGALPSVLMAGVMIVVVSMLLAFLSGMDVKRRIVMNVVIIAAAVGITYLIGKAVNAVWGISVK